MKYGKEAEQFLQRFTSNTEPRTVLALSLIIQICVNEATAIEKQIHLDYLKRYKDDGK